MQRVMSNIICRTHGPFAVGEHNHLAGEGCPACDGVPVYKMRQEGCDQQNVSLATVKLMGGTECPSCAA